MPDPISSPALDSPLTCTDEATGALGQSSLTAGTAAMISSEPLMNTPDAELCPTPNAVQSLVAQFTPATNGSSTSAVAIGGDRNGVGYTYLGATPEGGSYRAAAAFVKTSNGARPNLEAVSASVQYGHDADVQVTALRSSGSLSSGGYGISVTADALTARANFGAHNDDGSHGLNAGASAEFVGIEATVSTPAGSVTAGASLSGGISGSVGTRDADLDGKPEYCGKLSTPLLTVGACLEQFW